MIIKLCVHIAKQIKQEVTLKQWVNSAQYEYEI
jgi:hypothetical protein